MTRAFFLGLSMVAGVCGGLGITPVAALSVSPIEEDMQSSGPLSKMAMQVKNDDNEAVPIEIKVYRLDIKENGETEREPADGDFLIVPFQQAIKANSSQIFRIQWAGQPLLKSQTYVMSVNQMPVKRARQQSGVQFVYNLEAIINVAPPNGSHTLDLVSASLAKNKAGKQVPVIVLSNTGNAHAKFSDATLSLKAGKWSTTMVAAQIKQLVGIGLVQPGKKRRFQINLVEVPADAGPLTAQISYDKPMR